MCRAARAKQRRPIRDLRVNRKENEIKRDGKRRGGYWSAVESVVVCGAHGIALRHRSLSIKILFDVLAGRSVTFAKKSWKTVKFLRSRLRALVIGRLIAAIIPLCLAGSIYRHERHRLIGRVPDR